MKFPHFFQTAVKLWTINFFQLLWRLCRANDFNAFSFFDQKFRNTGQIVGLDKISKFTIPFLSRRNKFLQNSEKFALRKTACSILFFASSLCIVYLSTHLLRRLNLCLYYTACWSKTQCNVNVNYVFFSFALIPVCFGFIGLVAPNPI